MGNLLTIETGFSCNSRCQYCTQLDYRSMPQEARLDLGTQEILDRITWASQNGYDQVGFSGGEPTIRPDFIALIEHAKSYGFQRIGVTTNGRMFAYRSFAEKALRAGLDGLTLSLHGPTPAIHDKIAAAPGSLEQALTGLRHLAQLSKKLGIRLHLMNNQILLPDNTPHIGAMVELLAPLGVRLFMIQPFISQRSNVDDLGRFFVPYSDIVQAVREALPALQKWQARVKPYNVPNCLLWPLGRDHVESQFYGITVYREFEKESAGEFKAFRAKQWYRVEDCKTCTEKCPGFRIEQYPQERMVQEVVEAADAFAKRHASDRETLVFSGTELLTPDSLQQVWRDVAARHGAVAWMTGAAERSTRAELARAVLHAAAAGQLAEVVLVGQPMDQRFLAQRVIEKGNLEEIRALLAELKGQRRPGDALPRLRWLLNASDAIRMLQDPEVMQHWPHIAGELVDLAGPGGADLVVSLPNFPRGKQPPDIDRQAPELRAMAERIAEAAQQIGLRPVLSVLGRARGVEEARAVAIEKAEAVFAEVLPTEDWAVRLFRHALSSAELDFVSWSPPWMFERWDLTQQAMPQGAVPAWSNGVDERGFGAVSLTAVGKRTGLAAGVGRFGRASPPK